MELEKARDGSLERIGEWEVMEKFTSPKNPNIGVEDGLYIGKNLALVCDGVTSQTTEKIRGLSPGQFAVRAAIAGLQKPLGASITSRELIGYLTHEVRLAIERAGAQGEKIGGHPSFVFAAFFPKEHCIVRIRDCSYLIDGKGENPGFPADIRKKEMQKRIERSKGLEEGDEATKQQLREWQWKHRNSESPSKFSYAVVDGTPIPEHLIEYIDVPQNAKEVVLASDGYPAETLAMTLAETNHRYQEKMQKDDGFVVDDLTYLSLRRVR